MEAERNEEEEGTPATTAAVATPLELRRRSREEWGTLGWEEKDVGGGTEEEGGCKDRDDESRVRSRPALRIRELNTAISASFSFWGGRVGAAAVIEKVGRERLDGNSRGRGTVAET